MKFYIASGLGNFEEVRKLKQKLEEAGHEITYDWTVHGSVRDKGIAVIRSVAVLEVCGVRDCDHFILLWPGGRGTHTELGIAIALEKPIHFITTIRDQVLPGPGSTSFYFLPGVYKYPTASDFIQELLHGNLP